MNISDRLKRLRKVNNLTATFVSEKLGIAKSTLSNYENGNRMPKAEVLRKLAEIYNISLDNLLGQEFNIAFNGQCLQIPILNSTVSMDFICSDKNIIGYTNLESEYIGKGEFFALYVTGDSMNNSRICEGDIIIVKKQDYVENGNIAVVLIENEGITVKRVYCTDKTITLIPCSTNSIHRPRIIDIKTTGTKIIGKVVEVKIKL